MPQTSAATATAAAAPCATPLRVTTLVAWAVARGMTLPRGHCACGIYISSGGSWGEEGPKGPQQGADGEGGGQLPGGVSGIPAKPRNGKVEGARGKGQGMGHDMRMHTGRAGETLPTIPNPYPAHMKYHAHMLKQTCTPCTHTLLHSHHAHMPLHANALKHGGSGHPCPRRGQGEGAVLPTRYVHQKAHQLQQQQQQKEEEG